MTYEIPVWSKPIPDSELTPELRKKFRALVLKSDRLGEIDQGLGSVRAAGAARLHQAIQRDVTAHPILARTILRKKYTLLEIVSCKAGAAGVETIQFLIEANPYALLHQSTSADRASIHNLAGSGWASDRLLWVAEHYPWFFQHELCQQHPPHFEMMACYVHGMCDLQTVRRFYELYPQGLKEKDSKHGLGYPLWASLKGPEEPDADFFIWMAKQYPIAVHFEEARGYNILHVLCYFFVTETLTPNMAKIGRFLVSEHAALARHELPGHRHLPIHTLATRFNRPLVQEIVILLLKAYPECAEDVTSSRWRPDLKTLPFIQHVYPLVEKELAIDDEVSLLPQISQNVAHAAVIPRSSIAFKSTPSGSEVDAALFGSVAEVFCSWANLRVSHVLQTQKQLVQQRITDTCRLFEGDDSPIDFALRHLFEAGDDDSEEDVASVESEADVVTDDSDGALFTDESDDDSFDDEEVEEDADEGDENVNVNHASGVEDEKYSSYTYKYDDIVEWN